MPLKAWQIGDFKGDDVGTVVDTGVDAAKRLKEEAERKLKEEAERQRKHTEELAEQAKAAASQVAEQTKVGVQQASNEANKGMQNIVVEVQKDTRSAAKESKSFADPVTTQLDQTGRDLKSFFAPVTLQLEQSAKETKIFLAPITDLLDLRKSNDAEVATEVKHQNKMIEDKEIERTRYFAEWNQEISNQNWYRQETLVVINELQALRSVKSAIRAQCLGAINTLAKFNQCIADLNRLSVSAQTLLNSIENKLKDVRLRSFQDLVDLMLNVQTSANDILHLAKSEVETLKTYRLNYLTHIKYLNDSGYCQSKSSQARAYLNLTIQNFKIAMASNNAMQVRIAQRDYFNFKKLKLVLNKVCQFSTKDSLQISALEKRLNYFSQTWNEEHWVVSACRRYESQARYRNWEHKSEMLSACSRNIRSDEFIGTLSSVLVEQSMYGGAQ